MKNIRRLLSLSCLLVLLTICPRPTSAADPAPRPPGVDAAFDSLPVSPSVLITGVYFDPLVTGEASEAVQIQNSGSEPVSLAGWSLGDDHGAVSFPEGARAAPLQKLWVSKSANAFRGDFGFAPDWEYGSDSDSSVPNLTGSVLNLANSGDYLILRDGFGQPVDAVPYGDGTLPSNVWNGESVRPYSVAGAATEGQILVRKLRERDGLPIADTNTSADWAQDPDDAFLGRRASFPGWDGDRFFQPATATEFAQIKFCVAPDNIFSCYLDEILGASNSIEIETYALTNARLVDALVAKAKAGIRISVLLDAGALEDQGKWACKQIEAASGQCWLMDSKPQAKIVKRYDNLHGKWMLIDSRRLLVGSENMGDDGMPSDDKKDGTMGTRGGSLVVDSPKLAARAREIFDHDLDPLDHQDIRRWGTYANDYAPIGFVPNYTNGGNAYPVKFPDPYVASGTFKIEMIQCPDNCLRQSDALLGLIAKAGAGDTVLVEQLYERKFWGDSVSSPAVDPNIRLEAYINAARRGARVQLLLDSYYDTFSNIRSNYETCRYVNRLSSSYPIECRLGNPTGLGMHNKMVLVKHGGTGVVHLGSINGSETSSKLNRELAVQVESNGAYAFWASVFAYDWSVSTFAPRQILLPIIQRR